MFQREEETRDTMKEMMSLEKKQKRAHIPETEFVTDMKNRDNILEIENLHTNFYTDAGVVRSLRNIIDSIP